MSNPGIQRITSAANATVKQLKRWAQDAQAARKDAVVWVEGDHLCRAALQHGWRPRLCVLAERVWQRHGDAAGCDAQWGELMQACHLGPAVLLPDALFDAISDLESPVGVAMCLNRPDHGQWQASAPTVVLDRLQDPGNVGSILRSAAALGCTQVLALPGTVALYGSKVLRAGMGAHFALRLFEQIATQDLERLAVPLACTSSHEGRYLHECQDQLPWPLAWVFGHEGQGVSSVLTAQSPLSVRIWQSPGHESLNVAAAAAICLHASATRAAGRAAPSSALDSMGESP